MASVLAFRDYRLLLSGSLFSYSSQWVQQAALGWVVYEITGSGALLGLILGVRAIPMLMFVPISGVLADRMDRKKLLLFSQGLAMLAAVAFGAALALKLTSTWMLFAFTLLMGVSNVFDRPARLTTIFELVPRDLAMRAVALNSMGFSMTRILGPACAGYLIAWFGAAGTFFVQGTLYLIAGGLAAMVVFPPRKAPKPDVSAWQDLREGLRYIATDRTTRAIVVMGVFPFFMLVPVWGTMLPIMAKDVYDAGPQGLGIMLTGVGLGGTVGGLISHRLGRYEHQGRVQFIAAFTLCAAIAGLALAPNFTMAVVFAAIGGGAEMVHTTSNMSMLQMSAPEHLRGRVSSMIQLYPTFISLGTLMAGVLAEFLGVRWALGTLAVTATIVGVGLFYASPRLRRLRLSQFRNAG